MGALEPTAFITLL
jgi:hypothetical protein